MTRSEQSQFTAAMVSGEQSQLVYLLQQMHQKCTINGLFYGGGFHQLGLQLLGVITVLAWTAVTMTIVFKVIDKTVGLRVSEEEEIVGLDIKEHGLASAYAGFSLMDITEGSMSVNENTELGVDDYDRATEAQKAASVKVSGPVDPDAGMHKVVKYNR